ncbi:efflux RND transporter periplasmic adaptor subunit [Robiginitalea sp. M366]|uniref:efflux RND transporter periplasmic adaptor subunit n=1 Tax=Robiginitalea aestuariiviva TaxID=3036903 RepID=UPI00240E5A68|nr:efflux RND transporter periplasmic adaptor subunit [Robiginitalea aestuariiviva]MDG1573353.1 efflux RND transporter periplasmic adaptor subunit [Robiginitalea aestuariiviva]
MKTRYTLSLIAIALLMGSCGGDPSESPSGAQQPVAVTLAQAGTASATPYFTASGKVEAARQANLGTRMMGYVRTLHVKVGQPVQAGDLLLSLDLADLRAKMAQAEAGIAQAQAGFANAEKDYQRYRELFAAQSATQKELDDMTARYQMAKAQLEGARQMRQEVAAQFAYAQIKAPFDGVVTNVFTEAGDLASPGQPLVAVEAPGRFEVAARIPESAIIGVAVGDTVPVLIEAAGLELRGHVSELSTSARNTGGQYLATVQLDQTDPGLRSGMYATLHFPGAKKDSGQTVTVLIPRDALVQRGQLSGIYTVSQQQTAMLRWLRLGREYGDQVEVLSGLQAGETYIRSAEGKLFNGVRISTP